MPLTTSWSVDTVTCIACGQQVRAQQFDIDIHRQAHLQAQQSAMSEVYAARQALERDRREIREIREWLSRMVDEWQEEPDDEQV